MLTFTLSPSRVFFWGGGLPWGIGCTWSCPIYEECNRVAVGFPIYTKVGFLRLLGLKFILGKAVREF